ncbi:MAG: hypothetical protein KDA61_02465, partial [Planctomycetales bacterium]|nr:hypothetical protein [Planctomycetales bacterium]
CLLTGSGMAFPWSLLQQVPHPDADIVEDMSYAADLALAGYPPLPCMEARVHSALPTQKASFVSQRKRWEHGHLATIASQAPKLLWGLLRRPRLATLALLLETAVPPLSLLLVGLAALSLAGAAASWALASWAPIAVLGTTATVAGIGLALAWQRFGQQALPPRRLREIPRYVAAKLPLYGSFVTAREQQWVRTERSSQAGEPLQGPHVPQTSPERTEKTVR